MGAPSDGKSISRDELSELTLSPLIACMERHGISLDCLAGKLREELDASETKVFNGQDGIVYSRDLVAWSIRQKARQDAHKLRGDYPAERLEHAGPNGRPIQVDILNAILDGFPADYARAVRDKLAQIVRTRNSHA